MTRFELKNVRGEPPHLLRPPLRVQDENRGFRARLLHALSERASARSVNLANEDLDRSRERALPADLEAELVGQAGERVELVRVGGNRIPPVGMASRDLDRLATAPSDDDGRRVNTNRAKRCVVEVKRFVCHTLSPPQRRKNLTEARQAVSTFRKRLKGSTQRNTVQARESRPGPEAHLDAAPAGRLGDGDLRGEKEGVTKRRTDHVDSKTDAICSPRHRSKQGRRVPGGETFRRLGHMIEAGDEIEAVLFGHLPRCLELLVAPSPLAWLDADPHRGAKARTRTLELRLNRMPPQSWRN
jgi:hypothetical protein